MAAAATFIDDEAASEMTTPANASAGTQSDASSAPMGTEACTAGDSAVNDGRCSRRLHAQRHEGERSTTSYDP